MAGYQPYSEYKESRFEWGCDAPMSINVNIKQYVIGAHAANAGLPGGAMPLLPLKRVLTINTMFTIVTGNTPAKPRLAPASTLKSRGFFYAWRKPA